MRIAARAACAFAAFFLPHQALAQESDAESKSSDIVVTGDRDLDRKVTAFVGALTRAAPSAQLERFESPICPAALGLSKSNRAAVEQRLRTVAKAAGVAVAPEDCSVNVLLVVTDNKRAFIEALQNKHRRFLGNLTPTESRRLATGPGPTAAWQLTLPVTARGTAASTDGCDMCFFNRTTELTSRITTATRPVINASALVIERGALTGLDATQLADYGAMRLFGRTNPERLAGMSAPTILSVIDAPMGSEVPITLTPWDLGFLRGLYSSPKNVYSGAQRAAIVREIGKALDPAKRGMD